MSSVSVEQAALPITIRGVTKSYGDIFALDDVSLDDRFAGR